MIGTFAAEGSEDCSGLPVIGYGPDEHHHTPWGADQHCTWLVLQRRSTERLSATVAR